jgi:hypothetical protein
MQFVGEDKEPAQLADFHTVIIRKSDRSGGDWSWTLRQPGELTRDGTR